MAISGSGAFLRIKNTKFQIKLLSHEKHEGGRDPKAAWKRLNFRTFSPDSIGSFSRAWLPSRSRIAAREPARLSGKLVEAVQM
jgi:hypothetical protein